MIEIPESGIATRDAFEGIYISRVGDDTGGRWARGLFVEQVPTCFSHFSRLFL